MADNDKKTVFSVSEIYRLYFRNQWKLESYVPVEWGEKVRAGICRRDFFFICYALSSFIPALVCIAIIYRLGNVPYTSFYRETLHCFAQSVISYFSDVEKLGEMKLIGAFELEVGHALVVDVCAIQNIYL